MVPVVALIVGAAGLLALAPASSADMATVGGGAFGASVDVTVGGGAPTVSRPQPAVTLPASGGDVSDASPSSSVRLSDSLAPFGGRLLDTEGLVVTSHGTTASSTASASSASAAAVDALGGSVTTARVTSTCSSSDTGSIGGSSITGGTLLISATRTVALPANPAPNTAFPGTDADSGTSFTVILNEQTLTAGRIAVTGIHIILNGPAAFGDIVVARSSCAASPQAPPSSTTIPAAPMVSPPPSDGPPAPGATTPSTAASSPPTTVASRFDTAAASTTEVKEVSGGAYGFYAKVSLFNGPPANLGLKPEVTLPATGATPALTASLPNAKAGSGPANFLTSGEIMVSTQGTTGPNGSATSSASLKAVAPDTQFTADSISSTCSATGSAITGSSTFANGSLVTSTVVSADQTKNGDALTRYAIPANPAPNTEVPGTLDHIGDTFKVIFNEQLVTADSITVNAAHLYMIGPTAIGDLIVAQSRCGRTATAATIPAGSGGTSGTGGAATSTGSTGSSTSGATATQPAKAGTPKAASSGTSGASTATGFAKTGIDAPVAPGLVSVALGLILCGWGRARRRTRTMPRGCAGD